MDRFFLSMGCAALIGAILGGAPAKAHAQQAASSAPAPQTAEAPAAQFIQDLGNKAISVISDKSLTQDQRNQKYMDLLHDSFDLQTIGHFVLGRAWNQATPEQQQEYLKLFQQLVIQTYSERLSFYSGESFRVKGSRAEGDNDSVVLSEIAHPQGNPPTSIDWRVRANGGKFAIVDVMVEGVSQSVTQRQEYASILQNNNGNIDALLQMMRQRLQKAGTTTQGASP